MKAANEKKSYRDINRTGRHLGKIRKRSTDGEDEDSQASRNIVQNPAADNGCVAEPPARAG